MTKLTLIINKDGSHFIVDNSKHDWREQVDCDTAHVKELDTVEQCNAYLEHYERGQEQELNAAELQTFE